MEGIEALLAALERIPPVKALKVSFVAYPLVNAVHILAIGAVVTSVVLIDLRVLGFFRAARPGVPIPLLRNLALAAFLVAALTGVALFAVNAREYVQNPVFLAKMALLVLAIFNFLLFLKLAGPSGERPDGHPAPLGARLAAALSIMLWLGVVVCGRFIGFL